VDKTDLLAEINKLKDKLNRAMRRTAGLKEKSKCLEMQYTDARERETRTNELVMELIERQRELNVMLNRANIMLNRTQETLALTSTEFNEIAKALPEPKKAEWSDRVAKINELFKKTGFQEAEASEIESSMPHPAAFNTEELKQESDEAFGRKDSIWGRRERSQPENVEALLVDEEIEHISVSHMQEPEAASQDLEPDHCACEDEPLTKERRKPWWHRAAG
jgi:hypothetical protein